MYSSLCHTVNPCCLYCLNFLQVHIKNIFLVLLFCCPSDIMLMQHRFSSLLPVRKAEGRELSVWQLTQKSSPGKGLRQTVQVAEAKDPWASTSFEAGMPDAEIQTKAKCCCPQLGRKPLSVTSGLSRPFRSHRPWWKPDGPASATYKRHPADQNNLRGEAPTWSRITVKTKPVKTQ